MLRRTPPAMRLVGTILLVLATLACKRPSTEPGGEAQPSLLLVLIDTCRWDRMSLYGYAQPTTPFLARLAEESVVFQQALSHVPQTLPSTATLFTSTLPSEHGVRVNGRFRLEGSALTLAEVLAAAGYRTGAVASAFPLDPRFGIAQGFEAYDAEFQHSILTRNRRTRHLSRRDFEQRADEATDKAIRWLREGADDPRPFFLFVHYFDPHAPYDPPGRYRAQFLPYDGELALVDAEIERLVESLRQRGDLDETLVVVTGDHGEMLDPRRPHSRHAGYVWDRVLRVPLLLRHPGSLPAGERVGAQVGLVDVAPTILELLGLSVPETFRGASLVPLARGGSGAPRPVLAFETLYWKHELQEGLSKVGVRTEALKYVRNEKEGAVHEGLYDLARDPEENRNLLRRDDLPAAYRAELERLRAEVRARFAEEKLAEAVVLEPDEEERLRSLGYVR